MHSPARVKSPDPAGSSSGVGYYRVRTQTEGDEVGIHDNRNDTANNNNRYSGSTAVEMHDDGDNLVIVDHRRRRHHRLHQENDNDDDDDDDGIQPLGLSGSQDLHHHNHAAVVLNRSSSYRRGDSDLGEKIAQTVSNAVASVGAAAQGAAAGGGKYQQVHQQAQSPTTNSTTIPKGVGGLHNRSRSNSWDADEDVDAILNGTTGDDLFLEEDAVVRRYNAVTVRNRVPIVPAEFVHQPLYLRLWRGLQELRTAARQRRAARLLNDSQYTPTSHCLLTWCCDATDRGIALVAILLLLWLVVGFIFWTPRGYWLFGLLLFVIRVTARRTYEYVMGNGGGGARKQHRGVTGNSSSPSSSSGATAGTSVPGVVELNDYRDHA